MSSTRRCLHRLVSLKSRPRPSVTVDELLDFATRHVPYYRPYVGCGLDEFPLMTKDLIRGQAERLRSDDLAARSWHFETSGGSTGEPVQFIQDQEFLDRTWAATLESKSWTGFRPGDRLVKFWGNRQSVTNVNGRPGWKAAARRWLSNTVLLDTFRLDEQLIDEYIDTVQQLRPKLVVGFSTSLKSIAERILDKGVSISSVGAVTSTAGTLFPEVRQTLVEAFRCDVYNRYGSSEVGIIAAENGRDPGLQILPTVFVEVLRPDGTPCETGESGEIVVTSLANFAMPLVRFRIGDVGALGIREERPYLEKVQGRSVEQFRTQDGMVIDGQFFIQAMYFRDWVKKFRFRQLAFDRIVIELVTHCEPPRSDLLNIEHQIRSVLGPTDVEWRVLNEIPPLPSGKQLYTLCEIDQC